MLRELSRKELKLVAGGQTEGETAIMDLMSNSGPVTSSNSNWSTPWAFTSNGTTFVDRDGNGYYDGAFSDQGVYNPSTGQWEPADIEAEEAVDSDPQWIAAYYDYSHDTPKNVDDN